MNAATIVRRCRLAAGMSLRELAERAGTSHATLAAYEHGRVVPGVDTLARITRAAGFVLDATISLRRADAAFGHADKGDELFDALELAEHFPVRHRRTLAYPKFAARS